MVIFPFVYILLISGCPPMLTVDNFVWYRDKIGSSLAPAVGELWKKSYAPRFACASEGYRFLFAKTICWSLGWREIWLKGVIVRKMKVLSNHLVDGHGAQSHVWWFVGSVSGEPRTLWCEERQIFFLKKFFAKKIKKLLTGAMATTRMMHGQQICHAWTLCTSAHTSESWKTFVWVICTAFP